MSKDPSSEQAALITDMRRAVARKVVNVERNIMLQIAGMAAAVFVALFSVLYVMSAEPPLPEFQVTLSCDKLPRTRTVIIAAPSTKEAKALIKTDFPGCGIAPKRTVAATDAAGGEAE